MDWWCHLQSGYDLFMGSHTAKVIFYLDSCVWTKILRSHKGSAQTTTLFIHPAWGPVRCIINCPVCVKQCWSGNGQSDFNYNFCKLWKVFWYFLLPILFPLISLAGVVGCIVVCLFTVFEKKITKRDLHRTMTSPGGLWDTQIYVWDIFMYSWELHTIVTLWKSQFEITSIVKVVLGT